MNADAVADALASTAGDANSDAAAPGEEGRGESGRVALLLREELHAARVERDAVLSNQQREWMEPWHVRPPSLLYEYIIYPKDSEVED